MNSITKKTAAMLTAAIMSLSLVCCGNSSDDSSQADTPDETQEPVTVTLPPKDENSEPEETTTAQEDVSELTTEEPDAQPEEAKYAPAMWKVTSPEGKTMFLMGSMHALKAECYPLPDYVESAYRQADVLAVECDISDSTATVAAALNYSDRLTYPEGDSTKEHLDDGEWKDIASYIELHGDDPKEYENYQLWYLSQLLESYAAADAGLDGMQGIDINLLNDAHSTGKEIYEVESIEYQTDLLINFPEEYYAVSMSGYCSENNDDIRQEMEDMYEAWRTGNIDGIADGVSESDELSKDENEIMQEYYQHLIYDRNIGMEQAVKDLLAGDKSVFYLVGTAHFVGDKGILALLKADGYTVERIEA